MKNGLIIPILVAIEREIVREIRRKTKRIETINTALGAGLRYHALQTKAQSCVYGRLTVVRTKTIKKAGRSLLFILSQRIEYSLA